MWQRLQPRSIEVIGFIGFYEGFLMVRQNGFNEYQSSFSELYNSGNSAITVKGKGLTNVKMYVERNIFSKGKM